MEQESVHIDVSDDIKGLIGDEDIVLRKVTCCQNLFGKKMSFVSPFSVDKETDELQ